LLDLAGRGRNPERDRVGQNRWPHDPDARAIARGAASARRGALGQVPA
jgi:hypothetical protein